VLIAPALISRPESGGGERGTKNGHEISSLLARIGKKKKKRKKDPCDDRVCLPGRVKLKGRCSHHLYGNRETRKKKKRNSRPTTRSRPCAPNAISLNKKEKKWERLDPRGYGREGGGKEKKRNESRCRLGPGVKMRVPKSVTAKKKRRTVPSRADIRLLSSCSPSKRRALVEKI